VQSVPSANISAGSICRVDDSLESTVILLSIVCLFGGRTAEAPQSHLWAPGLSAAGATVVAAISVR
jgi:hypothetical protein